MNWKRWAWRTATYNTETSFVGAEGVRLIDYDGMFVPGMPLTLLANIGHANMTRVLTATLNRLGPTVPVLSYRDFDGVGGAGTQSDSLMGQVLKWRREHPVRASDFIDPGRSALLRDLERIPDLSHLITPFRAICSAPLDRVPMLERFSECKSQRSESGQRHSSARSQNSDSPIPTS